MRKTLSLLFALCLLFCVSIPAFSVEKQEDTGFQFRRLVVDERDADGNLRNPYWVDEDGNEVEMPAPEPRVRAAAYETPVPEQYDLREHGGVTPVKDQAKSGSCWAFSTIACMESNMAWQGYGKAKDFDYSEAHLAWFSQHQRAEDEADPTYGDGIDAENPFDDGSNLFFSTATLMRGSGVQLESNAPWTNPQSPEDALRDMAQPESDRYACYGRLYDAQWMYYYDVDEVKQALLQNGNVSAAYFHFPGGYNEENACHYQNLTNAYSNHAVEIAGWDDSFPKENFNESMRPRRNGAWLVKGSWGMEFGKDGYYWLSYYDPSINSIWTLTAKPKNVYDNIYQYDGTIPLAGITHITAGISHTATVRAANRFRSTKNETLTHVAFWSENYWGVDASIRVYVADEDYVPDADNPTANMTLVDAATTYYGDITCGYYTAELARPVDVSNRYYTVELIFSNNSSYYPYVTMSAEGSGETAINLDLNLSYGTKAGQSFIYENKWIDCTKDEYQKLGNVPIKAMTRDSAKPTGFTLTYDAGIGHGAPDKQTGSTRYYIPMREPTYKTQYAFGVSFLGWTTSKKTVLYRPGDPITLTADTTLYAVWQEIEKPIVVDPDAPAVEIVNFVQDRTERFFTTMEFTAVTTNMPDDAQLVWAVNGNEVQVGGETFVYSGAKKDFNVKVRIKQGGKVIAASQTEHIDIQFTFADIFTALFRLLLNKPYYVKQ